MAPGGAHGGCSLVDSSRVPFLPQSECLPVVELYGLLVSRFFFPLKNKYIPTAAHKHTLNPQIHTPGLQLFQDSVSGCCASSRNRGLTAPAARPSTV